MSKHFFPYIQFKILIQSEKWIQIERLKKCFGITGDYKFRSKNLTVRFGEPFKVGDMTLEEANKKLEEAVGNLMKENLK